MARQRRIEYCGAYYHVMARGNHRNVIFQSDTDRTDFMKTLERACERTDWKVHAWVLMPNHYHLLVETPDANLVEGMTWLQNTYTRRFNVRNKDWGRLFGDRYKAIVLNPQDEAGLYYRTLLDYIHLNPARKNPGDPGSALRFPWSSLVRGYLLPPKQRPPWMATRSAFSVFGLPDTPKGRKAFLERLVERAKAEGEAAGRGKIEGQSLNSTLERGWFWGSESFKEKLLMILDPQTTGTNQNYAASEVNRAKQNQKVDVLLGKLLKQHRLSPGDLDTLPGNNPKKVEIAHTLYSQTCCSQKWIADRLKMKSPGNVAQCLYLYRQTQK